MPFVILSRSDTDAWARSGGHDVHVMRAVLALCLASALLVAHPYPAAACSAGPFDPRDHTQLLVLGKVRSIAFGETTGGGFLEATVGLDVIQVFRGAASSALLFVDAGSALVELDPRTGIRQVRFAGGSGACGTIDDSPVGKFVLIALARGEDSRWHANRLYGALYSDRPDYAAYRLMLERYGIAVPFLVTGPNPDTGLFGAALAP